MPIVMKPNSFNSLHDYLDALFLDVDPTDAEIKNAKKIYWRSYNTHLKRRRRKQFPTFQISFSLAEIAQLKSRLQNGQSISKYIHELVIDHLSQGTDITPKVNTAIIEQQLFLIGEYLRELLDYDTIDTHKIEVLETHIQTLEDVIHNVL